MRTLHVKTIAKFYARVEAFELRRKGLDIFVLKDGRKYEFVGYSSEGIPQVRRFVPRARDPYWSDIVERFDIRNNVYQSLGHMEKRTPVATLRAEKGLLTAVEYYVKYVKHDTPN